jgi:hypothetical protein
VRRSLASFRLEQLISVSRKPLPDPGDPAQSQGAAKPGRALLSGCWHAGSSFSGDVPGRIARGRSRYAAPGPPACLSRKPAFGMARAGLRSAHQVSSRPKMDLLGVQIDLGSRQDRAARAAASDAPTHATERVLGQSMP